MHLDNLPPERLTTSALQVSVLEHLALDIVRGVEHHQVQVHLVAPVPVLAPQRVGPRVTELRLENLQQGGVKYFLLVCRYFYLQDGGAAALVLLPLHLVLLAVDDLVSVLPPAEGRGRLPLDVDPPDCHPVHLHRLGASCALVNGGCH